VQRPAAAYGIAIAALAAAVLLRWLLDPVMGDSLPLVTLFGAVAAAAWVGGVRPAVLVVILGYAACNYLFVEPRGEISLAESRDVVGLIAYLFTCSLIIGFGEAMRRALRRASESREALQITLSSIGDAVITTDIQGRVTYLNPVAESLTGWTYEQALDRPLDIVFRIVNEQTRQVVASPVARALRDGTVVGLANHTVLIRKDGTETSIDDSAAPIRDERGQVSGCVLIFRDTSERRSLERTAASRLLSAQLLAAIVESSDDAIISKSLDGIIQTWNAAAERLFGHTAGEAVGRHISLIIPAERMAEEDRIIESLRAGQRVEHFQTERLRGDGTLVTVSLTISPVRDEAGNIIGASKIARDITSQQQAEAERQRLADDLLKLAADLTEADRRKNEFLATLAHELRNPLAPLSHTLEVLRRAGEDPDVVRQSLDTMERQLGQMVRLVDDLLDLSRITHDRIDLRKRPVDLSAVLEQAVQAARPLAEADGHEMRVTVPPEPIHLHADPVRLSQVFGNLLNNSCKYTDPGGKITVTAARQGDHALVTIRDTGTGIPPDKLGSIFDMFTQVDPQLQRSQGGLGIGLTLVKRLVEMHGGSVEAPKRRGRTGKRIRGALADRQRKRRSGCDCAAGGRGADASAPHPDRRRQSGRRHLARHAASAHGP
jgi:PAS domain S-box-containing protein